MDREQMLVRTRAFAVRIIKMVAALPPGRAADVIGRQVLKSGTAIGSNYREALYASSRRHFVTTLEIAQREGAETLYWLDLLAEAGVVKAARLEPLTCECREIMAILTATIISAKRSAPSSN